MNILLSNQKQIIEQAKFTYSLLRKSSQKTKKKQKNWRSKKKPSWYFEDFKTKRSRNNKRQ